MFEFYISNIENKDESASLTFVQQYCTILNKKDKIFSIILNLNDRNAEFNKNLEAKYTVTESSEAIPVINSSGLLQFLTSMKTQGLGDNKSNQTILVEFIKLINQFKKYDAEAPNNNPANIAKAPNNDPKSPEKSIPFYKGLGSIFWCDKYN